MKGLYLLIPLALAMGCASPGFQGLGLMTTSKKTSSFEQEMSLARLSERHGKTAEAEAIYRAVIETQPNHQVAHHRLGVLAAQSGDLDRALEHFADAERCGPPNAALLSDIGYAHYLQDRLDPAEAKLRHALQLDPRHKASRNNLGQVLAEQGRFDEALVEFRHAVGDAEALANLAYVQTRMGRLEDAAENCHRAPELRPQLASAANILVQVDTAAKRQNAAMMAAANAPKPDALEQNPLVDARPGRVQPVQPAQYSEGAHSPLPVHRGQELAHSPEPQQPIFGPPQPPVASSIPAPQYAPTPAQSPRRGVERVAATEQAPMSSYPQTGAAVQQSSQAAPWAMPSGPEVSSPVRLTYPTGSEGR